MSAREEAIEAAARAVFETEYPTYSETACPDSNRWSWLGDGHTEEFKDAYRKFAAAALSVVPGLLNDLADRIEADAPKAYDGFDRGYNAGIADSARLVRAAAEGWGDQ